MKKRKLVRGKDFYCWAWKHDQNGMSICDMFKNKPPFYRHNGCGIWVRVKLVEVKPPRKRGEK